MDLATTDNRQGRREMLKRQLAEIDAAREKIKALRQVSQRIDGELDEAVERHADLTKPLQDELQSIEDAELRNLTGASDTMVDNARRVEILSEISRANYDLEEVSKSAKRRREKIQQQIRGLQKFTANSGALRNELRQLADPELLDRQWMLARRQEWATSRLKEAGKWLATYERELEKKLTTEQRELYADRVRRWELETADAAEIASVTEEEIGEIQKRMENE